MYISLPNIVTEMQTTINSTDKCYISLPNMVSDMGSSTPLKKCVERATKYI